MANYLQSSTPSIVELRTIEKEINLLLAQYTGLDKKKEKNEKPTPEEKEIIYLIMNLFKTMNALPENDPEKKIFLTTVNKLQTRLAAIKLKKNADKNKLMQDLNQQILLKLANVSKNMKNTVYPFGIANQGEVALNADQLYSQITKLQEERNKLEALDLEKTDLHGQIENTDVALTENKYYYIFFFIFVVIMVYLIYRVFVTDQPGSAEMVIVSAATFVIVYHYFFH